MADFVFISPAVKFKEIDLTVTTSSLGITTAGLVGETTKGPAFEPIFITSQTAFRKQFGSQSKEKLGGNIKYLLPYYANQYLNESNQLYVTRILGLSGYAVGKGWALKISAGLDESTLTTSSTSTGNTTFTGGEFSGQTVTPVTGVTYTIQPSYTKVGTTFTGIKVDYQVTSFENTGGGLTGTTTYTSTTLSGQSYAEYENMVVAIVRTRGSFQSNVLGYNTSNLSLNATGVTTNVFGEFTLNTTGTTNEQYVASLDPSKSNYLPKVIGANPKDKTTQIYVESIYPDLIKKLEDAGYAYGISSELVVIDNTKKTNFATAYKTPETPWVVSELRGNSVSRLFKFISISDGDSANKEIKITFNNINPETREFDVLIRDFNDTDDNIVLLESYTRCSMNPSENTFIGKRIGDNGENYDNLSKFVYLEFADIDNLPTTAIPAGFEGYNLRSYDSSVTDGQDGQTPKIFYKKSYLSDDKLSRTYLGISERGYDTSSAKGTGISQNFFNFNGELSSSATTKTKGFHMDSGATGTYSDGTYSIGQFEVGDGQFRTAIDVAPASSPYNNKQSRKFTLVPYGGFDGWDIYRDERTNRNSYRTGGVYYTLNNDYDAYLAAIRTYANSEDTQINLFATPGINWSDNSSLVDETLDMIESERQDSLYLIDAPDLGSDTTTYASDITDLLATTDINSSYAATYGPWIQIYDQENSSNLYIPATGEVLRVMAFTDNSRFPWFAPAGLSRGLLNARKSRVKLPEPQRDILYAGRINPIADFSNVGVDIFGQKTLQVKQSALDRINVRRLLLYIRKVISTICLTLLFEQNDDVVVEEFLNKVNPILLTIKRERGLSDFKIVYQDINTPETRDRKELYFNIYLKPVASLEFIGVNFIITPSGASFENV